MRYAEQVTVHIPLVQHLRQRAVPDLVWFHSPQGAAMVGRQGALMKALGMRAGVSDLILLHKCRFYALELKRVKDGRASAEQRQFINDVLVAGGEAYVAKGLDDALRVLEHWGLIRGSTSMQQELPFIPDVVDSKVYLQKRKRKTKAVVT